MLKEIRTSTKAPVLTAVTYGFNNLTNLKRLIMFFILILLHTVSKIGMNGLLYILTFLL